jgi:hypothetical protein
MDGRRCEVETERETEPKESGMKEKDGGWGKVDVL